MKEMDEYFVKQAMQHLQFLDELGGPDSVDSYVGCMMAISRECLEAAGRALENREKLEPRPVDTWMRPATMTERTVWAELWNKQFNSDIGEIEDGKGYVKMEYCSDGPGYQGPVGVVFWGEPHFVSIFTWDRETKNWGLEANYGE